MKFFVIDHIKADDRLALLFNRYISKLRLLDAIALPRETMRELRELKQVLGTENGEEEAEIEQYFTRQTHFYSLTVLSNSLHNFHAAVVEVIATINTFFEQHQGDLHADAVARRYQFFRKFGSEDASDYGPDGKILRKEDAESLKTWGLWHELADYFCDAAETGRRQEQIGSSSAEDFAEFTRLVSRATDFSVRKAFQRMGHEVAVARVNEAGDLQVLDLPNQVEAELNEDLRNERLAREFGDVWDRGGELAVFFRSLDMASPTSYRTLLHEAQKLLALDFSPLTASQS